EPLLAGGKWHRCQERTVGKLRQAETFARDAGVGLDVIVPRRDVAVADRPVGAVAVPRIGLEVEVAHPVALAAPHYRLATNLATADPVEGAILGSCVRIVDVVDEELGGTLVARITFALDRLAQGEM